MMRLRFVANQGVGVDALCTSDAPSTAAAESIIITPVFFAEMPVCDRCGVHENKTVARVFDVALTCSFPCGVTR